MKTKFLLALTAVFLIFAGSSQAGWGWGGGYCGPRGGWGGGYYGHGWGGWGWGGPSIGISFPVPIVQPVYYAQPSYVVQPAPYYVQHVVRVASPSSTLANAQARLANLGYYRGAVDGTYGPLTNRAIAQFQADYGLQINGRLDRATLKSLGV